MTKKIIIITGPTASGKTSVAVRLAQHLHTPIISADSRQCFKELNIGVARPSTEQLRSIHHYFIASHSIIDEMNAALFEELALQWTANIFQDHDTAIMVGGTGLYIKSFCEGLDPMPPIDLELRNNIQLKYEHWGLAWLQDEVQQKDPVFYAVAEVQNPQRLMRALEIQYATGKSILSFRSQQKKIRPFEIVKIGLHVPKKQLHAQINERVDQMMADGLLAEVERLAPYRQVNALQTVGYPELFSYFNGKTSLPEAVELIKKNTRHYAKRQLTWFRKDDTIQWINPDDWETLQKITQS